MSASAKPATAEQLEVMAELKTYGIIVSRTLVYEWNG